MSSWFLFPREHQQSLILDEGAILDEGGIRLREPSIRYVPFETLREVRVTHTLFDRPRIYLSTETGGVITASLPRNLPHNLCAIIEAQRDAARETSARMKAVRGDMGSWIAMVAASHAVDRDGALYRSAFVDLELLDQTLSNPTDAIEARATAAHALLARNRSDLVLPRINFTTPPLLIAAARLGRGGEKIVPTALLESILPFLDLRDRIVFEQRMRRTMTNANAALPNVA